MSSTESHDLPNDEVHVWHVSLTALLAQPNALAQCDALLSPDERRRAARFHFERDRQCYIVSHGTLRMLLSRYTLVAPAALQFMADSFGKPRLADPTPNVHFNLSHSQDQVAIAVARAPIGIDIEHIRPFDDALAIAQAYFLPNEAAWLNAQPVESRPRAFFQLWTCKEAYLKALGDGLSARLNTIDTRPTLHTGTGAPAWQPLTPTHHLRIIDLDPACACAIVAPLRVTEVIQKIRDKR